ncbi:hypothetical protein RND81_04G056400 [Saponaria officinalis]|uniref:AB hydrolase-1 domain-containing protein n=1 Tax=Saponaria officinalis TaxID=3572 RepID=A0AAW1LID9_SAPOF
MRMRVKNGAVILLTIVVSTWIYQSILPPSPQLCGYPGGPPITASRVKLRDGRYLAYKETGVSRENAKHKILFIHGFGNARHDVVIAYKLPQTFFEELGVCIISFDRPGYGESDPDPNRTLKSTSLDIEELADQLKLGDKFYVAGFSMGGQTVWGSLKYIPHRLAGAVLIAPVVNYWWDGFPTNLSKEAFQKQFPEDQWALRVAHYIPWLTYWWNTQKFFPGSSVAAGRAALTSKDYQILSTLPYVAEHRVQVKQQGEYESLHRDMIIGFGAWEFSPLELSNPIPNREGAVQIWQGDDDALVPVTLQRYIAEKLPWIRYHEIAGAGHMFPLADGMPEVIIRSLLGDS